MLGAVRSGLLFGIFGTLIVIVALLIPAGINPILGFCLCGPFAMVLNGFGTGYLGVRWNKERVGIGMGVLAGGIAGLFILVGFVLLMMGVNGMLQMLRTEDPTAYQSIIDAALATQPNSQVDRQMLEEILPASFFFVGMCLGLLALTFTIIASAGGAWLWVSQRDKQNTPPAPPSYSQPIQTTQSNPTPASFDPPPLSPRDDQ